MNDISRRLKRLRNEDIIWIIYFFIVVFALYSNKLNMIMVPIKMKNILI